MTDKERLLTKQGITMKLPDSTILGTSFALTLSHDSENNFTEGIVLCNSDTELENLASTILLARDLAAHPLAIPVLFMDRFQRLINEKLEDT